MGSLPFAFSVHHFINSVGADAGFASIIGLAILILLYFAQARETANLRNHAYQAAQRIQELEARVAQAGRVQPQAAAQRAPTQAPAVQPGRVEGAPPAGAPSVAGRPAAATAAAPSAAVGIPVAPAGVGAPALTAATKLIPTPSASIAPPQPPDATVIGAAPAVGPPATVAGQGAPAVAPPDDGLTKGNGAAQELVTSPPRPMAPPVTGSPPPIQLRSAPAAPPPRRPPPRPAAQRRQRSFGAGRLLLALVGVLVLGGVVAALLIVTSNNGSSSSSNGSRARTTNTPGATKRAGGGAIAPASVTVAVLNGTATSGLAHRVALKLSGNGYKEGTVATATDQTKTATIVSYLPGFRRDALAVASSLKLRQSAVAPVDSPTQSVACPPPNPCPANVVVTVGADLATSP